MYYGPEKLNYLYSRNGSSIRSFNPIVFKIRLKLLSRLDTCTKVVFSTFYNDDWFNATGDYL